MPSAEPPQRLPVRYRLYVDESGDHTYNLMDDAGHRYLALLGVWFRQENDYTAFADDLERFKRELFGPRPDNPVILHRSEIINRRGPFGALCQAEFRASFDAGIWQVMERAKFRVVGIVIDKKVHAEKYSSPFHPYHYCLAVMLDRYSGWLTYRNAVGDVMAESRGKVADLQLGQAYLRVFESGTLLFGPAHHQRALTSKAIKFRSKQANIAGLQLADLLAYPIRQACLVERGRIPDPGDVYGKRILQAVETKFNRHERTGQIQGYGKVWL